MLINLTKAGVTAISKIIAVLLMTLGLGAASCKSRSGVSSVAMAADVGTSNWGNFSKLHSQLLSHSTDAAQGAIELENMLAASGYSLQTDSISDNAGTGTFSVNTGAQYRILSAVFMKGKVSDSSTNASAVVSIIYVDGQKAIEFSYGEFTYVHGA